MIYNIELEVGGFDFLCGRGENGGWRMEDGGWRMEMLVLDG